VAQADSDSTTHAQIVQFPIARREEPPKEVVLVEASAWRKFIDAALHLADLERSRRR
jgi:hypothetical protein